MMQVRAVPYRASRHQPRADSCWPAARIPTLAPPGEFVRDSSPLPARRNDGMDIADRTVLEAAGGRARSTWAAGRRHRLPGFENRTSSPAACRYRAQGARLDAPAAPAQLEPQDLPRSRLTLTGCGVRSSCAAKFTRSPRARQRAGSSMRSSDPRPALGRQAPCSAAPATDLGRAWSRHAPGPRGTCRAEAVDS